MAGPECRATVTFTKEDIIPQSADSFFRQMKIRFNKELSGTVIKNLENGHKTVSATLTCRGAAECLGVKLARNGLLPNNATLMECSKAGLQTTG